MVSFHELILGEDSPIYLQIIQYVKRQIVSTVIQDGDDMPSRRMLSSLLGVNPNTIQKAYKILEDEQLLQSQTGAKSLITITEETITILKKELLETDVKSIVKSMQGMGIEKKEAISLLDSIWKESEV